MTAWENLRPLFRDALFDAVVDEDTLDILLKECGKSLKETTILHSKPLAKLEQILDDAEEHTWLQKLVEAAQQMYPIRDDLPWISQQIVAGIKNEGDDYYRKGFLARQAGSEKERILLIQLQPYLKALRARTMKPPLPVLDAVAHASPEAKAVITLEQVFIDLDASDASGSPASAISHIHAKPQLLLLGEPGSGKSTLMNYVAYCLAGALVEPDKGWQQKLSWEFDATRFAEDEESASLAEAGLSELTTRYWEDDIPLPVLVNLKEFAESSAIASGGTGLVAFIEQDLKDRGLEKNFEPLKEFLERGRALLVLEDLDRVPAGNLEAIWSAITGLDTTVYGGNRWVVTSRIAAYAAEKGPAAVPPITIGQLSDTAIERFAAKWGEALQAANVISEADVSGTIDEIKKLPQVPGIGSFARNPLMLTLMAVIQIAPRELRSERTVLFQECLEFMLAGWQVHDKKDPDAPLEDIAITLKSLEYLLRHIVWQNYVKAQTEASGATFTLVEASPSAVEVLGGDGELIDILNYAENKTFLLQGSGAGLGRKYNLAQGVFEEYLAASHLASLDVVGREVVDLSVHGERWREVIILTAGILAYNRQKAEIAIDVIEKMVPRQMPQAEETARWRRVWLAGEMCAVIDENVVMQDSVGCEVQPVLKEQLAQLLAEGVLPTGERASAGDVLGHLGDTRPGVTTLEPELRPVEKGSFLAGEWGEQGTIDQPFFIARYPVTVAQFARFIDDDGYSDPAYWGGDASDAWKWRLETHDPQTRGVDPVSRPQFWLNDLWHVANRPVVGVSWYEASAYCAWLSKKTGNDFRLPTALEWERAARHTDGREYAWGPAYEADRMNCIENEIKHTTAVGTFPRGLSHSDLHDMNGNVWEWTGTVDAEDERRRVAKGGAWNSPHPIACTFYPMMNLVGFASYDHGFRVAAGA